jgi:hypothetical protein
MILFNDVPTLIISSGLSITRDKFWNTDDFAKLRDLMQLRG